MAPKFLRLEQVRERIGSPTRATIARWEKEGKFPMRKQLGDNSVAWLESEIDAWIKSRTQVCSPKKAGALSK